MANDPKKISMTKAQALDLLARYESLNSELDHIETELMGIHTLIQKRREQVQKKELYQKIVELPD